MFGLPVFGFLTAGQTFLKGAFNPALTFSAPPLKTIEVSLPLPDIDSDPPASPSSSVINLASGSFFLHSGEKVRVTYPADLIYAFLLSTHTAQPPVPTRTKTAI
jgi:hypothetical protein